MITLPFPQIGLFQAHYIPLQMGEWNARNVHSSFWRFYVNDRDGLTVTLHDRNDEVWELRGGRPYLIPDRVRFSCDNYSPSGHFYVHFDVLNWPLLPLENRSLWSGPVELPQSPALLALVEKCRTLLMPEPFESDSAVSATYLYLQSLICAALAIAFEQETETLGPALERQGRQLSPLRPALAALAASLESPPDTGELAALCGYSPDYFARLFKAGVGTTPARYGLLRRLDAASQQLLFTRKSIDEIARETGFVDRSHFSRAFAAHWGVPPAAYRKSRRV